METPAHRIVMGDADWVPAQQANSGDNRTSTTQPPPGFHHAPPSTSRLRSMSVSLPWRRPKSALYEDYDGPCRNLDLEKCKSHGFHGFGGGSPTGDANPGPGPSSRNESHRNIKGMLRRASVSLRSGVKGLVQRRTSVPAETGLDGERPRFPYAAASHHAQRPTTAHSTWHRRLRQAASFNRQSRVFHSSHEDYDSPLGGQPDLVESPTFPIPGSGEQPPIIPRSTGAAARLAAANAHHGAEYMMDSSIPRPGWLAGDALDDHESGIGIAVTSSEMELSAPHGDVDSDVDVDATLGDNETSVIKVDFVLRLPTELVDQILGLLDGNMLNIASRVSRMWKYAVQSQYVWRVSFLREKTTTYATGALVKPGVGLGVPPVRPGNDWKAIYRVREQLDKRWKDGKPRHVYLNGHTDSIYCLQFDETKIITGSRDRTIRVWDMETYACKLVIGPPDVVGGDTVLYDATGAPAHFAATGDPATGLPDTDGRPRYSHHSIPQLYSPTTHHNASILCLQFDHEILVTGSSDSTCIVYDLTRRYHPVRRLQHHTAAVLDLVFDDKHIVTCSKDVSICVWDRATGALLKQLRGHSGPVNAVQMRGNLIVSCSGDFRVKLWNIDTGKSIREFDGHTKGLACSQFTEDGRYIASAGNDRTIRLWDANTGECLQELDAHGALVRSLHVDSVSGRLVSGSYDSDIKVWDMETGVPLLSFPKWHNSWVLSAKSDYRRIVSSGQDPKILILDFGAGLRDIEMLSSVPPGEAVAYI